MATNSELFFVFVTANKSMVSFNQVLHCILALLENILVDSGDKFSICYISIVGIRAFGHKDLISIRCDWHHLNTVFK